MVLIHWFGRDDNLLLIISECICVHVVCICDSVCIYCVVYVCVYVYVVRIYVRVGGGPGGIYD